MASEKSTNPFETLDGLSPSEPPPYTETRSNPGGPGPGPYQGPFPMPGPEPFPVQGPGQFPGPVPGPFSGPFPMQGPGPGPFQPPPSSQRVIAIPAIAAPANSPFMRAYAPSLAAHNLPKESFLAFLDQLNKAVSSSPPLQVLDATGGILQSVPILFPLHWIGSAVSGLANLGSQGVSKSRADSSIRQANKDIFGPRGLKLEIAKLDAVAHVAGIPILDSHGKVTRQAPLYQHLQAESSTSVTGEPQNQDAQQRLVYALQPWISQLEFEFLPWTTKSKLTRFNAALKKRNDPDSADSRSSGPVQSNGEEAWFRKCLWLVITEESASH